MSTKSTKMTPSQKVIAEAVKSRLREIERTKKNIRENAEAKLRSFRSEERELRETLNTLTTNESRMGRPPSSPAYREDQLMAYLESEGEAYQAQMRKELGYKYDNQIATVINRLLKKGYIEQHRDEPNPGNFGSPKRYYRVAQSYSEPSTKANSGKSTKSRNASTRTKSTNKAKAKSKVKS